MTSIASAPTPSAARPASRPGGHLRVVTTPPRRTSVLAGAGLYLAGLSAGSLLVAATTAVSGGSGAVFALALAASAGVASVVTARVARTRNAARAARVARPRPIAAPAPHALRRVA